MKRLIIVFLCISMIFGCTNSEENLANKDMSELEMMMMNDDKLIVYISGTTHGFISNDEKSVLYPTKSYFGLHKFGGEMDCYSGNVIAQAVLEYSEMEKIPIEIHFIEEYMEEGDPLQKLYIQNELPDILIVGKYSQYNYISMAEQGLLLDFSAFLENDEEIKNPDRYYQRVLDGTQYSDEIIGLPILFNLNGLITSEKYMRKIGVKISENATFDEIIYFLEETCQMAQSEKHVEAIYETSGSLSAGRYIPNILLSAAYPEYWDQNGTIIIEKEVLQKIFGVTEEFNKQEFIDIIDWENNSYFENLNSQNKWSIIKQNENVAHENIAAFLTGGRCGGVNLYNNILTDAMYFQAACEERNDTMVLTGIPSAENEKEYSANISLTAFGFSTTKYPGLVYELGRYLMDYTFPTHYGFSINKDITQNQLDSTQKSHYLLYPDVIWSAYTAGDITIEDVEEEKKSIDPVNAEYVATIEYMLDHIGGAGLPCKTIEYSLLSSAQNMIGEREMTSEGASKWLIEEIERFMSVQNSIDPFM